MSATTGKRLAWVRNAHGTYVVTVGGHTWTAFRGKAGGWALTRDGAAVGDYRTLALARAVAKAEVGRAMTTDEMRTHVWRCNPLVVVNRRNGLRFTITPKRSNICDAVVGYGIDGKAPHRLLAWDELWNWLDRLIPVAEVEAVPAGAAN